VEALDDVMETIVQQVEGSIGCAVADLRTGELVGLAQHTTYLTREYFGAVAEAAVEMFRGRATTAVEDLITEMRGVPTQHFLEEVQMTTKHTIHFMMVMANNPDYLVALICNRETSLGIGWAATRASVLQIDPILDTLSK
jgi:hypothetical protein